jgi:hypothetical protein
LLRFDFGTSICNMWQWVVLNEARDEGPSTRTPRCQLCTYFDWILLQSVSTSGYFCFYFLVPAVQGHLCLLAELLSLYWN